MAYNNFKRQGTFGVYVSKAGHDSNSGSDPNAPRKSLFGGNNTLVGAGDYTLGSSTGNSAVYYGDGRVILRATALKLTARNSSGFNPENLTIIGCPNLWITVPVGSNPVPKRMRLINCSIINPDHYSSTWVESVFINVTNIESGRSDSPRSSIVISSNLRSFSCIDSYVDENSSIAYVGLAVNFRYSNVRGIISLETMSGWKEYAIKDQLIGTPQDNGYGTGVEWLTEAQLTADGYTGTVSGWDDAVASCMNRDPKFNDAAGEDFTLQADSPHIRSAEDGISNIGGTSVAISVLNTDDGAGGVRVIPSSAIDTSIPTAFKLKDGETEGYVDYIIPVGGRVIEELRLKDMFSFDSDYAGGSVENNNVSDAQPLTEEYAQLIQTSAVSVSLNEVVVPENLIEVGNHIRVLGQHREVVSKVNSDGNDTLTLDSDLAGLVDVGVDVSYGTELQLAALNPNRLTVLMRTRSASDTPSYPFVDSEWDNEIDPSYGVVGQFFHQEVDQKPGLIIDGLNVYGAGDSYAPTGIEPTELAPQWIHLRVYKRNNYSSSGL